MQQDIENIRSSCLTKEQFRTEIQKFTTQVFGAECHVEYDGNYLNPLNGFRINKSNYKPSKGDVVVIWVNNHILTQGIDYVLVEGEEDYWEVALAGTTPGMYLTVQI